MPYCLVPHGLLSLSCKSEDHLPRGNSTHSGLCLLTSIIKQSFFIYLLVDQSYGDIFSIESSSFHTTLTCIKLTITQQGAHGGIGRASKGLRTPISSSFPPCNINSLSFGPTPFLACRFLQWVLHLLDIFNTMGLLLQFRFHSCSLTQCHLGAYL